MSRKQLVRMFIITGGAALVVCAGPAIASAAPFEKLAQTISSQGKHWGQALLVLGGLVAGGSVAMGARDTGEKIRNFVIGAVLLVLAAGGGQAMLEFFADLK